MHLEVNSIGVDYIIKALAYQEAKLMDQVGEFKKMNQEDLYKSTQREAEIIHALRIKIEQQKLDEIDF